MGTNKKQLRCIFPARLSSSTKWISIWNRWSVSWLLSLITFFWCGGKNKGWWDKLQRCCETMLVIFSRVSLFMGAHMSPDWWRLYRRFATINSGEFTFRYCWRDCDDFCFPVGICLAEVLAESYFMNVKRVIHQRLVCNALMKLNRNGIRKCVSTTTAICAFLYSSE